MLGWKSKETDDIRSKELAVGKCLVVDPYIPARRVRNANTRVEVLLCLALHSGSEMLRTAEKATIFLRKLGVILRAV